MSDEIDSAALALIVEWAKSLSSTYIEMLAHKMAAPLPVEPQVDNAEIDRRLARLNKLFVNGNMTDADYLIEREELESMRPVPAEPSDLPTYEEALGLLTELPEQIVIAYYNRPELANQLMRAMIDRIELTDGEIVAFYPTKAWIPVFAGHPLMRVGGQI